MKVIVYSTQTCGYCKMAKQFLSDNKIEYTEVDVGADEERAEEMIKISGQMGVPVIVITKDDNREEVLVGFEPNKLKQILNIK